MTPTSDTRSVAAIEAEIDETTIKRTAWAEELSDCRVEMEAIARDLRESGVDDFTALQSKADALSQLIGSAHQKLAQLRADRGAAEAAAVHAAVLDRLAGIVADAEEAYAEMWHIRSKLSTRLDRDFARLISLHDQQVALRNEFIENASGFNLLELARDLQDAGRNAAIVRQTWFGSRIVGSHFDLSNSDLPMIGYGVDGAIGGYIVQRHERQMHDRALAPRQQQSGAERERLKKMRQAEEEQWRARQARRGGGRRRRTTSRRTITAPAAKENTNGQA